MASSKEVAASLLQPLMQAMLPRPKQDTTPVTPAKKSKGMKDKKHAKEEKELLVS